MAENPKQITTGEGRTGSEEQPLTYSTLAREAGKFAVTTWRGRMILIGMGLTIVAGIGSLVQQNKNRPHLSPKVRAELEAIIQPESAKLGRIILRKANSIGKEANFSSDGDRSGGVAVNFVTQDKEGNRFEAWARMLKDRKTKKPDPSTTYEVDVYQYECYEPPVCSDYIEHYQFTKDAETVFGKVWYDRREDFDDYGKRTLMEDTVPGVRQDIDDVGTYWAGQDQLTGFARNNGLWAEDTLNRAVHASTTIDANGPTDLYVSVK